MLSLLAGGLEGRQKQPLSPRFWWLCVIGLSSCEIDDRCSKMSSMWAESRGGLQRDNPEGGPSDQPQMCSTGFPKIQTSIWDPEDSKVKEGVGSGGAGTCCLAE